MKREPEDPRIYIADIRPLADESVFRAGMRLIMPGRRQRIVKYRGREDRQRSLAAGLLLEYGLEQSGLFRCASGGMKQAALSEGSYGKPYLPDSGLCFNLSHSGNFAAAVFSKAEAGIDIEKPGRSRTGVARRFFRPEEEVYLQKQPVSEQAAVFAELWTRKESYIKAVGEGMRLPLTDFSVLSDRMEENGGWNFATFHEAEGYVLSVCCRQAVRHGPQTVELSAICAAGLLCP